MTRQQSLDWGPWHETQVYKDSCTYIWDPNCTMFTFTDHDFIFDFVFAISIISDGIFLSIFMHKLFDIYKFWFMIFVWNSKWINDQISWLFCIKKIIYYWIICLFQWVWKSFWKRNYMNGGLFPQAQAYYKHKISTKDIKL